MGLPTASGHPFDAVDIDHDGWQNPFDNCPESSNPKQQDNDADSRRIAEVPPQDIPQLFSGPFGGPMYGYTEGQGIPTDRPVAAGGDECDVDDDNDNVPDQPSRRDNCPRTANRDQADTDLDGTGDACDPNDDSAPNQQPADDPHDTGPPRVTITIGRSRRYRELLAGLVVWASCSKPCRLVATLVADRPIGLARAPRAKRRQAVGSGAAELAGPGTTFIAVRLSRSLLHQRPTPLHSLLRVTARNSRGNAVTLERRLLLRR